MNHTTRDVRLLFATRIVRMFAYGLLSVVLVLHLAAAGLSESQIGLLLTLTLLGDTAISLFITTRADRIGRRRMLMASALPHDRGRRAVCQSRALLAAAPRRHRRRDQPERQRGRPVPGGRAGRAVPGDARRAPHRRLRLVQPGRLVRHRVRQPGRRRRGRGAAGRRGVERRSTATAWSPASTRAAGGRSGRCSSRACPPPSRAARPGRPSRVRRPPCSTWGSERSRGNVFRLAGLFSIDAFAGGFVVQAFVAYWFQQRFGVSPSTLGSIFFGANILAGLSALSGLAGWPGASGCSPPWSPRTSRRTCCWCSCR